MLIQLFDMDFREGDKVLLLDGNPWSQRAQFRTVAAITVEQGNEAVSFAGHELKDSGDSVTIALERIKPVIQYRLHHSEQDAIGEWWTRSTDWEDYTEGDIDLTGESSFELRIKP